MNPDTLYRSSLELEVKGRTLEGLALPFETWAKVRDLKGPSYMEAHARSSFDETLRRNPEPRPLYSTHEWAFNPTAEPLGVAHFVRSATGLMYRAFLSRTVKADEQLELIRDGAKRDVSVGFDPLQFKNVQRPEGPGKLRTENRLKELSIAPTGFGQYPQAGVFSIRSTADATFADITEAVLDAVRLALFGEDGPPDGVYVYLAAIGEGWTVYCIEGGTDDKPELNDTWRYEYAIDADGVVTLSDTAERVEKQYVPIAVPESATRSEQRTRGGLVVPPMADRLLRMRAGRPPLHTRAAVLRNPISIAPKPADALKAWNALPATVKAAALKAASGPSLFQAHNSSRDAQVLAKAQATFFAKFHANPAAYGWDFHRGKFK